jgi:hypothetical protein
MSTERVIAEEAREIYEANPDGTKEQWGSALFERLTQVGDPAFDYWLERAQLVACARAVERAKREAEASRFALAHDGRALPSAAMLSVAATNADGDVVRQLKLFRYCTPQEFVEAVRREEAVLKGRFKSNEKRLELVGLLALRPELMGEPTIEAAIKRAGLDPDEFFLDEEANG